MKGRIESLRDHYILCGYGRVGRRSRASSASRGVPFVVVESQPGRDRARAQAAATCCCVGDATSDDVLREAGIERARGLLAASDSDSGNTFIVLTAKALNPDLFVVSRAAHPESEPRMQRAGADRVFSPYVIAGRQMALSALQPAVVEFIDTLATGRHGEQHPRRDRDIGGVRPGRPDDRGRDGVVPGCGGAGGAAGHRHDPGGPAGEHVA